MTWLSANVSTVFDLAWQHLLLAGVPLLLGLALSIPIGWAGARWPRARGVILGLAGLLYTIPSLALFVLMPVIIGTGILSPLNVIIAMTLYTVALLVRTVVDGLTSVPDHVTAAATAMGYGPVRRFLGVELPLAVPVVAAGLRVAAVSNVSIVSVASLLGVPQLGDLLIDGFSRDIPGELITGIAACLVLALALDLVIRALAAALTPWRRAAA